MIQIFRDDLGDWVTLYLNGEKKLQGHSIRLEDVVELLGIPYEVRDTDDLILANVPDKADELEAAICNLPNDVTYLNKHLKEDKQFT